MNKPGPTDVFSPGAEMLQWAPPGKNAEGAAPYATGGPARNALDDIAADQIEGGAWDVVSWGAYLETGIAALDQQHRKLVDIINALGKLLSRNIGLEEKSALLQDRLADVMNYVQYHFGFEIRLMRECRLSCAQVTSHQEVHKAEHVEFTRHITEAAAAAAERPNEVLAEVIAFLSRWLPDHIVATDLQMAKMIKSLPETRAALRNREGKPGVRQVFKAMRESRNACERLSEDYANTLDMLPGGVYSWRIHPDGKRGFEYANRTFCKLLDVDGETLCGDYRSALSAVHRRDLDRFSRQSALSRQKMLPFRWEGRVAVGGETRRISVQAKPQQLADGSSRWIGLVTDITDYARGGDGVNVLRAMSSETGDDGGRETTSTGRYRACAGCQSIKNLRPANGPDTRYSSSELRQANAVRDDLVIALEQDQFGISLQPQIDHQGKVVGAEALLRWQHPERGLIPPSHFISALEVTGIIIPVGERIIEMACRQLGEWSRSESFRHLTLSVNVSASQFRDERFVDKVREEIARHGINPRRLKLELTESMMMRGSESAILSMETLRTFGVQLSLDDFGTGYSSLQYLRYLPIDQIKIDRSFVRNIASDGGARAILHSIIDLADALGLDIIAEGVETEAQKRLLVNAGCKCFQGYLLGRPMPLEQFEAWAGGRD